MARGRLSPAQIAAVIFEVGGWAPPPSDKGRCVTFLDTAIAVCLAESGGNPNAKNSRSSASGLWQIMVSVHEAYIRTAILRWRTEDARGTATPTIFDIRVNTDVARRVFQDAGGWSPWEAYNKGTYRRYLGHGEDAYAVVNSPARLAAAQESLRQEFLLGVATAKLGGILSPGGVLVSGVVDPVTSAVDRALSFLKSSGVVAGAFALGLILLILGVVILVSQSKTGKKAIKVGTKVGSKVVTKGLV